MPLFLSSGDTLKIFCYVALSFLCTLSAEGVLLLPRAEYCQPGKDDKFDEGVLVEKMEATLNFKW